MLKDSEAEVQSSILEHCSCSTAAYEGGGFPGGFGSRLGSRHENTEKSHHDQVDFMTLGSARHVRLLL